VLVVAIDPNAAALLKKKSGGGFLRCAEWRLAAAAQLRFLTTATFAFWFLMLLAMAAPSSAASNRVRITNLSDVAFGTIANLGADAIRSENVCLYADTNTNGYHVTATGTGPGGSFQLSSGTNVLGYDVLWSSSSGQTSGLQLTPNVPLTGQVSTATQQACGTGPATSASLVVVLRSTLLSSATAGTYNGTLTLVVGPE
jgi:hypothetical protein